MLLNLQLAESNKEYVFKYSFRKSYICKSIFYENAKENVSIELSNNSLPYMKSFVLFVNLFKMTLTSKEMF